MSYEAHTYSLVLNFYTPNEISLKMLGHEEIQVSISTKA